MTTITITLPRALLEQALEALEQYTAKELTVGQRYTNEGQRLLDTITALRAALAQQAEPVEPVQEQDIEDAIEAAYWQFDCRRSGLNEWASAPQSERDAFKAEARKLVRGYFPTRQAQDTKREMLAIADAFIRGKRAALAEPTGKESLQVESVVAENATTSQQQIEQTPPSEYRRGYWAGFAIGKREGRIEAEDELAQQAEPGDTDCHTQGICQRSGYGIGKQAEPVEPVEPVYWEVRCTAHPKWMRVDEQQFDEYVAHGWEGQRLYTAPPQRPAEPVQEPRPAAWDGTCVLGYCSSPTGCENDGECRGGAAPPQRKPLTEEEIRLLARDTFLEAENIWNEDTREDLTEFTRAVERAHGIGRQSNPQIEDRLARHGIPKP